MRWATEQHHKRWNLAPGLKHGKAAIGKPSQKLTNEVLQLRRTQIRQVVGLLTGHCHLRKHLHRLGVSNESTLCRLYYTEDETASHIIYDCDALIRKRTNLFGNIRRGDTLPHENLAGNLLCLISGTGLL
jgi:hypothetical protein